MLRQRCQAAPLVLAAMLALTPIPTIAGSPTPSSPPQSAAVPDLEDLLDVMGRVAGLYLDNALSFTCLERITDTRYAVQDRVARRTTHRFDYFYVFDREPAVDALLGVGATDSVPVPGASAGRLQDYRTSRSQQDGAVARIELGDVGLPAYLERAYSWVFIFQPGLRDHFDFALEGRDKVDGRPALVVRFDPRVPYEPGMNDWFGRAWIDADRYQLLRVEAVQSQEVLAIIRAGTTMAGGVDDVSVPSAVRPVEADVLGAVPPSAASPDGFLFAWARVDFEQDTNGMRFPSRATLIGTAVNLEQPNDQSYRSTVAEILRHGIARGRLFRVQHQYGDYRFFSVRTVTEIDLALGRPQ